MNTFSLPYIAFLQFLQTPPVRTELLIPLALIGIDLFTGIVASLKQKTFTWAKTSQFLSTNILPYFCACILLFMVWETMSVYVVAFIASAIGYTTLVATLVKSIMDNTLILFGNSVEAMAIQTVVTNLENTQQSTITQNSASAPSFPVFPLVSSPPPMQGLGKETSMNDVQTMVMPSVKIQKDIMNAYTQEMPALHHPQAIPAVHVSSLFAACQLCHGQGVMSTSHPVSFSSGDVLDNAEI